MKLNFKILFFIAILVFSIFAITQYTSAIVIDGAMGIVDDVSAVTVQKSEGIMELFWIGAIALGLLVSSILILNWASGIGMHLGEEALGSVFITIGYTWTLGMVNMFLLIAFVFIALLYILDIETNIVDKKTLPIIIIVAFFINFSLLFVKLIIDFFIILETSVAGQLMPAGISADLINIAGQASLNFLIYSALPAFIFYISLKIATILTIFGGLSDILKTTFMVFVHGVLIYPMIMNTISNMLMALVFFLYSILFIARSIIIYVFAMLAPLAIASLIFPKTREYFHKWLKQLVIWGLMGTIIIFVLGFGFHMRALVIGGFTDPLIWGWLIGGYLSSFLGNFFFAIYALISLFMIKKLLPAAVQGAINTIQKGTMMAAAAGGGFVAAGAMKKYGGAVQKKLQSSSEKYGGPDSMFGRITGDMAGGIEKKMNKEKEKTKERYNAMSHEQKIKIGKEQKTKGSNESNRAALFESVIDTGGDLTEDVIKGMGYSDLEEFKKIVGPKFFATKTKHLHASQKIQKNQKRIEDYPNDIHIKKKAREEIKAMIIGEDDPKVLQQMFKGNAALWNDPSIQDGIQTKKPEAMWTITEGNNTPLKKILKNKFRNTVGMNPEDQISLVSECKNMIDAVSIGPGVKGLGTAEDVIEGNISNLNDTIRRKKLIRSIKNL